MRISIVSLLAAGLLGVPAARSDQKSLADEVAKLKKTVEALRKTLSALEKRLSAPWAAKKVRTIVARVRPIRDVPAPKVTGTITIDLEVGGQRIRKVVKIGPKGGVAFAKDLSLHGVVLPDKKLEKVRMRFEGLELVPGSKVARTYFSWGADPKKGKKEGKVLKVVLEAGGKKVVRKIEIPDVPEKDGTRIQIWVDGKKIEVK